MDQQEEAMEEATGSGVDVEKFLADTLSSCRLQSPVPPATLEQECCMGIDEAGRGPVLGPMVYGTAFCPMDKLEQVKDLGVADSKVLSEEKRDGIFKSISSSEGSEWLGWKVEVLSPSAISNGILQRNKYNLNAISHDAAIGLIRQVLEDGVRLKEVYVDTVGDATKYQDKLSSIFPQLSITVSKKADSIYPIVSAASICAKVIRDACLKNWRFVEKLSVPHQELRETFGSGYTSDPNTVKWLKTNLDPVFGYPTVVRFSWSTCRELLEDKAVEVQWELLEDRAVEVQWPDDEETEASMGCAKLSKFFSKTSEKQHSRHRYFEERTLKNVSEF